MATSTGDLFLSVCVYDVLAQKKKTLWVPPLDGEDEICYITVPLIPHVFHTDKQTRTEHPEQRKKLKIQ